MLTNALQMRGDDYVIDNCLARINQPFLNCLAYKNA